MHQRKGRYRESFFVGLCAGATILPLVVLVVLVGDVLIDSLGRLSLDFIRSYPSRKPEEAGIWPALIGSLFLIAVTAAIAIPVGIAAAIYLEEYGRKSRVANIIEVNIANLAGVPSIIYGLLGLEIFVRFAHLGRSILAGALTMALLILPVIILSAREALATVPNALREGCFALGATRWQTIRRVVLPMAAPGILTGTILSVARAIGETAPLITIGALTYVGFLPDGLLSPFTVLPIQIFNWLSRPQAGFVTDAAAGIVVLLVILLVLNGFAIYLRNRLQKRIY
ncbi:phosphate ABC transporter permease PstA [bacterium]|nr:phosphate ABC transporter permease PstA [bacterium]